MATRAMNLLSMVLVTAVFCARAAGASPEELLDKAIKAHGGKDAIAKQQKMTWSDKGTYYGMGTGLPFEAKSAAEWPKRFRMEIAGVFTTVIDGDKGWLEAQGTVRDLTAEELKNAEVQNRVAWAGTLLPLKTDGYKLAAAESIKVNGKEASGIKATKEGTPDVTLWFDVDTNLLVKSKAKMFSQEKGKEVEQESVFTEHKEFGGGKMPTKYVVSQDGEKFVEGETYDVKLVDKLDEKLFTKP